MNSTAPPSESAREDAQWIATILGHPANELREECFAKLMRKYWKLVNVLALSKIGDRREAEDIGQEAFIRAFRSLDRLEQPAAFLGWLLRIVRNLVTDHLRARRSRASIERLSLDQLDHGAGAAGGHGGGRGVAPGGSHGTRAGGRAVGIRESAEPTFEQDLELAEEMQEVLEAMDELPERYREVLALKYLQDLDGRSMSELLGEPEGTVRNRLFRGLEKLRAVLEQRRMRRT